MIDINCDMGESYGHFRIGNDEAIMEYVDSCNIACGFHGGDPLTIEKTIKLAIKYSKNIGAHPAYPDLAGFGRRAIKMNDQDFASAMLYQIAVVKSITELKGGRLHHVKPHGALYHDLFYDKTKARIFCELIEEIQNDLVIFTNPGSMLGENARALGLEVWIEAFADRRYNDDLSLVTRSDPNAVIQNPETAARQSKMIAQEGIVLTRGGKSQQIIAHTICIHGDTPNAVNIAKAVRKAIS